MRKAQEVKEDLQCEPLPKKRASVAGKVKIDPSSKPTQKRYPQKYTTAWESDEALKDWIEAIPEDPYLAWCRYCNSTVVAHLKSLRVHATTMKHLGNDPAGVRFAADPTSTKRLQVEASSNKSDPDYEEASKPPKKIKKKLRSYSVIETAAKVKKNELSTPSMNRRYFQKYSTSWESDELLKDWIAAVPNDVYTAYCRYCRSNMVAHLKSLQNHATTNKHIQNAPIAANFPADPISVRRKCRELEVAVLVACRLPLDVVDELGDVLARGFCDTGFRMHRTKCSSLITSVLAPHFREQLRRDLATAEHVSLFLSKPMDSLYCLCIRYYSEELQEVTTTFLRLIEVKPDSAHATVLAIKTVLHYYGLDTKQIVGLAADADVVGVMVAQLVKRDFPDVILIKCTCQSLARVAMRAMSELPDSLDYMIRESHNWFVDGEDRMNAHAQLYQQVFGDLPDSSFDVPNVDGDWRESGRRAPRTSTRWLVRAEIIDRMLEHYELLAVHFVGVASAEKCYSARLLGDMFGDLINRAYLVFLKPMMTELKRLEQLFRLETGNLFLCHEQLHLFFTDTCRRFVKPTIFRAKSAADGLHDLDFEQPESVCLSVDGVDFGQALSDELDAVKPTDCIRSEVLDSCFRFLKTVATECRLRLSDSQSIIKQMAVVQPTSFQYDFSVLCSLPEQQFGCSVESLEQEVRVLGAAEWSNWYDLNTFWTDVLRHRDLTGANPFPYLSRGVMRWLVMPVTDAEVERIFRRMDLIGKGSLGREDTLLLAAILTVKYGLRRTGTKYTEFVPPKELLRSYESRMYD